MLSAELIKDIAPSVYKLEKRFRLVERNFGLPSFDPREKGRFPNAVRVDLGLESVPTQDVGAAWGFVSLVAQPSLGRF